jgi:hypothetical protein
MSIPKRVFHQGKEYNRRLNEEGTIMAGVLGTWDNWVRVQGKNCSVFRITVEAAESR